MRNLFGRRLLMKLGQMGLNGSIGIGIEQRCHIPNLKLHMMKQKENQEGEVADERKTLTSPFLQFSSGPQESLFFISLI